MRYKGINITEVGTIRAYRTLDENGEAWDTIVNEETFERKGYEVADGWMNPIVHTVGRAKEYIDGKEVVDVDGYKVERRK